MPHAGKHTFERLWRPWLQAQFDEPLEDLTASQVCARLARLRGSGNGVNSKSLTGHLIGGYTTLMTAMGAASAPLAEKFT